MAKTITQRTSDEALKKATGKTWPEWFALLDSAGGKDMPHNQIARWLVDSGGLADPWWGQCVTIGYEQHIGRRVVGQDCYGNLYATASKTVAGDLDDALSFWLGLVAGAKDFNGVSLAGEPRVSSSEKFRYWRATFADGSAMSVTISAKAAGKCSLAIDHRKLTDADAVEGWKAFWKLLLAGV